MNAQEMVDKFIQIRDFIENAQKALDEELKPAKAARAKLENMLLKQLQDTGAENIRTVDGTVYTITRTNVSIKDRKAFLDYVRENDLWDQMDVRASKETVLAHAEEEGEDFPGVQVTKALTIGVRRS